MRSTVVTLFPSVIAAVFALGCTVEATVKTQKQFIGQEHLKEAAADYNSEQINVKNANGDLIVRQDSSTTKVKVSMRPVAWADDDEHKADAEGMWTQVIATYTLTESAGTITINCGQGSSSVGSSKTGLSGCRDLTVTVPAGKGIKLNAFSDNGSVKAENLSAAEGATLEIRSDNGSVDAVVTGGAKISSDNGDVTVSATPTKGSTLEVTTGNGDIELSLPSSFAADAIALSAGKGVKVEGFSDLTATSTSRGTKGEGAASITAKASELGELTVKSR